MFGGVDRVVCVVFVLLVCYVPCLGWLCGLFVVVLYSLVDYL